MNQRTWLDHTVYRVNRNERTGNWEATILLPTSQVPMLLTGEKTSVLTVEKVRELYGESADRLPYDQFQAEVERRITHSEEMLVLLKNNWTGQDLSGWHVYGSIQRPMAGIKIEGTIFLNGNGAKYNQYTIYEYVVAREPLDARTIKHYTLIAVSHP
ncbi:MAG: hypothetical protein H0U76_22240 [Ktedonobacteraceae bacterium]|nr:hypothetical protein [Ktedonobacteraceae bacterium]